MINQFRTVCAAAVLVASSGPMAFAANTMTFIAIDDGLGVIPPSPNLPYIINGTSTINIFHTIDLIGVLEFDISSIPDEALATKVSVILDVAFFGSPVSSGNPTVIALFREGNGQVGPEDLSGSYFGSAATKVTSVGENEILLAGLALPAFQELIDNDATYLTVALSVHPDEKLDVNFHALESSVGNAPRLVIEYVPEPTTLAMLGCTLGAGLLRRRRLG